MAQTIGEILKKARLAREITIIDVSKETHIRPKYIEALENDQPDSLPSPVHARGFLRMIADALDLPSAPLLDAWESGVVDEQLVFSQPDIASHILPDSAKTLERAESPPPSDIEPALPAGDEAGMSLTEKETGRGTEFSESLDEAQQTTGTSNANEIFLEIGQTLRTQRESLGLSLNDIEHYTHIRMFFLQSIEAGRINELPSTVQGKGMIESYAQFLDIDADALMLRYADGLQTKRAEHEKIPIKTEKPSKPDGKPKKQPGIRKLITPDLLIGSLVIITLVIFAVWSTSRVIANRNRSAQETIPAISEMLAATSSGTPLEDALIEEKTAATDAGTISGVETTPNDEDSATPLAISITETATAIPFTDNLPVQVYIIARQRAYLKVIVDDITAFDGRITPGNAMPFSGNEKIEVITGNAAALQILYNQTDLGTIGTFGQVVDLILTQQGVITPTPRFTPTATQTVPATITLEPSATPETPTITPLIP